MNKLLTNLVESGIPSIRLKIHLNVLGADPGSLEIRALREELRISPRVQALLALRQEDGTIPLHPYQKWFGAHWVLSMLAELGYPPGDEVLIPLREQVYKWLFSTDHEKNIRTIEGRVRRCASQESNAAWSLMTLGLADARTEELLHRLIKWQWVDGGWNCDKNPLADISSFHESLIPLRALALHARLSGKADSLSAAQQAADIFLKRHMFRRLSDGSIISANFLKLHYPTYWHYDVLSGLRVMAEAGFIHDPRCNEALDWLETRQLPEGGFPADEKYYQVSSVAKGSNISPISWGATNKKRMNEFVSADALFVLTCAGHIKIG
jgi:hypothetical protein